MKNIEKMKFTKTLKVVIFIIMALSISLTLLFSLLDSSSATVNIAASISTLSVLLKIVVEVKIVGYEKIEHLESQSNIGVFQMKIESLEKQLIEKIHIQEIVSAQSVSVNTVEHQEIHLGKSTYEDEVITELRSIFDPVEIDATTNGGLDAPFITQPYDNLNLLEERIETSRYIFKDETLNNKFIELKKYVHRFADLFHKNITFKNGAYIGIFEYTDMMRDSWRPNRWFTQEQMDCAKSELDEANELLKSIIISYREMLEIYRKSPPKQGK